MLLSCTFFYIFQLVPAVKRRNENVIVFGFFFSFILSVLYDWFFAFCLVYVQSIQLLPACQTLHKKISLLLLL